MPRIDTLQGNFSTGELSPLLKGRPTEPRYKQGLEVCTNFIPTLQGPVVRRPGSIYAANVKDSTSPPVLIPFSFSLTQNYMLEFGNGYIRFFFDGAAVITSGTSYKVSGFINVSNTPVGTFFGTRANLIPRSSENITSSVSVSNGTILELPTPYSVADVPNIRFAQDQDVIYLFNSKYPTFKLERLGTTYFTLQQVLYQDGPYQIPLSYKAPGDLAKCVLATNGTGNSVSITLGTNSSADGNLYYTVTAAANDGTGQIKITVNNATNFQNGDLVFISGVTGTVEANTSGSSAPPAANPAYWPIQVVDSTHFILLGSTFVNAWVSGGKVWYGNFGPEYVFAAANSNVSGLTASPIGLVFSDGGSPAVNQRYWGWITSVTAANQFNMIMGYNQNFPSSGVTTIAQAALSFNIGKYGGGIQSGTNGGTPGWPACGCFHQNRLAIAGCLGAPLDIDLSKSNAAFELFSPSPATTNSTVIPPTVALTPIDTSAFTVSLLSPKDASSICWVVSTAQGLLAGNATSEFNVSPSSLNEPLTFQNYNPQQTSYFGSANIDALHMGNAVMHVQRAQRKVRELNYYFQIGTFRSSDMTELSEHITNPMITQLALTKETQPLLWAVRGDGALVSMVYQRDDVSVQAGWAKHFLGGASDANGSPPIVHCIASIPSADTTFDQLWMVVKRRIAGSTVYTIEYMSKIFDELMAQQDAITTDCSGTYDLPITISGITIASQCVVTANSHGFSNGQRVRFDDIVGLNISATDANGNVTITNLLNGLTFAVSDKTSNTFKLKLINTSTYVSSTGYGAWISGGEVRALVTTISGFTGFEGETFGVYADGGIHPDVVVDGSGNVALNWAAAVVQLGYRYKSQGQVLRTEGGSATGTSFGKIRRTIRAAFNFLRTANMSIGTSFTRLIPIKFGRADVQVSDLAPPLFTGIKREGLESAWDFDSQVCFEDDSPAPATIVSITSFMEEEDV